MKNSNQSIVKFLAARKLIGFLQIIACVILSSLFAIADAQVKTPLSQHYKFVKNENQWDRNVLFKARLAGGALFIGIDRFTYHMVDYSDYTKFHARAGIPDADSHVRGHAFEVVFQGAQPNIKVSGMERTKEYYNYYLGNDQTQWASHVWGYEHIRYNELYPQVNLDVFTKQEQLKYEFTIAPGGNPEQIIMHYNGVEKLKIKNGELIIPTLVNQIIEEKPYAYQIVDGEKVQVKCKFHLEDNDVSFVLSKDWDHSLPLIIDPTLVFASYSGSTADNFGMTATYDYDNNLISGGTAFNIGFPTTLGAYVDTANVNGTAYGVTDVVITKYDSLGTTLVFSTYLGGGTTNMGTETIHSLIVNSNNDLFALGVTSSEDFPTTIGAFDSTYNGGSFIGFMNNGTYFYNNGTDIWVSKLSADGTALLASTYVGGSGNDGVNCNKNVFLGGITWNSPYDSLQHNYGDTFRGEIMLDSDENVLIASTTKSTDFPTVNGFQLTSAGTQDAVVFKLDSTLSNMIWGTYLGGSDKDAAYSVKVDSVNTVYVAGGTVSSDFPVTAGVYDNSFNGGKADAFIAKISADGSNLLRATYFGTASYDQCFFVELDRYADVYVVGQTLSPTTFPITPAGVYSNPNSGQFIAKFDNSLTTLIQSTVFGNGSGNADISPSAFLVDVCQNVYVSGWGGNILTGPPLSGMPLTSDAIQPTTTGYDFYLFVINRDFTNLLYATYFGGTISKEHVDGGTSRFDKNGIVYQSVCAGCGGNSDFPTTPGVWSNLNLSTNCNNGTLKFDFGIQPVAKFDIDTLWGCAPFTITLTNNSSLTNNIFEWQFGNGDSSTTVFSPTVTYTDTGTFAVTLIITDTICQISDTALRIITVFPELTLAVSNDTALCVSVPLTLVATSNGSSLTYVWSSNNQFTDTINTNIFDSTLNITPTSAGYYYVSVQNPWCRIVDSVLVSFIPENFLISPDVGICTGMTTSLTLTNLYYGDSAITYNWSPDSSIVSGDGTSTIIVAPDTSTTYYVSIVTLSGCTYSTSTNVLVSFSNTSVNAYADKDTIVAGETTVIHALPYDSLISYSWNPVTGLGSPDSVNSSAQPLVTTTYTVTVTDSNGCFYSYPVTIVVYDAVCGEPDIYVPNAFTPNGDNNNDLVFVRGNNIATMNFEIYDRWGELMFQTDNQNQGWDGTYKSMDADPAVFVYHLKGTCYSGDEFLIKGNITLIR